MSTNQSSYTINRRKSIFCIKPGLCFCLLFFSCCAGQIFPSSGISLFHCEAKINSGSLYRGQSPYSLIPQKGRDYQVSVVENISTNSCLDSWERNRASKHVFVYLRDMNKTNSSQSLIFGVPVYIIGQISRVLPHLFRGPVTLTLDFRIMCDLAKNFGCFRLGFSSREKRSQA